MMDDDEVLKRASKILFERRLKGEVLRNPSRAMEFLQTALVGEGREIFGVILLGPEFRVISFEKLFMGTIDRSVVYPREVLKAAIVKNATSMILVHSHPNASSQPSSTDIHTTETIKKLSDALGIRLMDHYIVGTDFCSMYFHGWKEIFESNQ